MPPRTAPLWAAARPSLAGARRIVVFRVDEIGDVVLTTPFLRELRRNAPEAHITLVVKPGVLSLVETLPYMNRVLTYDWLHRRVYLRPDRVGRLLGFWWRHLRTEPFDLALVPRRDYDYYGAKVLAYLSGAGWRVGYDPSGPSEPVLRTGGAPLLTHVVQDATPRHEAVSALNMLRTLGGTIGSTRLELRPTSADELAVDRVLAEAGVGGPLVGVAVGAGSGRRRWPVERFGGVVEYVRRHLQAQVVVVGGPGDAREGALLARGGDCGVFNLAGRLSLRQTAVLLGRCRLFLGNDSGPMHLAVTQGTPVVEVSCHPLDAPLDHANSPARFGPWEVPDRVVRPVRHRRPCRGGCRAKWPHCILGVSVADVQHAVAELWSATAGA